VDWYGQRLTVDVGLLDAVRPGDRVLVHAGLALEKVDPEAAAELEALLAEWDVAAEAAASALVLAAEAARGKTARGSSPFPPERAGAGGEAAAALP